MIIILRSDLTVAATHDDTQESLVLAAADYAGAPMAWIDGTVVLGPGDPIPAGAVATRPVGGVYAPPFISSLQYIDLFTQAEQDAILLSNDGTIRSLATKASAAQRVFLTDAHIIAGLDYLTTAGILAPGRKAQILSNTPPA